MGSSGVGVDQSQSREGDFCLAGWRNARLQGWYHSLVPLSVRGGSAWQVVVFGGAGTLLRALMVGPRQKKTVEFDIKLAGNGKTFSRGLPKPLSSSLLEGPGYLLCAPVRPVSSGQSPLTFVLTSNK